jgi:hypothetical protein
MSDKQEVKINAEPIENNNTPKIDMSDKKTFLVFDDKTKSILTAFDNMHKANLFVQRLVKKDILLLINHIKASILLSDKDDDLEDFKMNTERMGFLKSLLYQYETIDKTKNIMIHYVEKTVVRYFVFGISHIDDEDIILPQTLIM